MAQALQAECVSLWSGRVPDFVDAEPGMERLVRAIKPVLDHAENSGMTLAFEPEPGMFIETLRQFGELDDRISHPLFQLTVDLGHVHCLNEGDLPTLLSQWQSRIKNIHIEDMVQGVHEHLMFGEGTMEFNSICAALHRIAYKEGVHVELSRHSHMGVEALQARARISRSALKHARSSP